MRMDYSKSQILKEERFDFRDGATKSLHSLKSGERGSIFFKLTIQHTTIKLSGTDLYGISKADGYTLLSLYYSL